MVDTKKPAARPVAKKVTKRLPDHLTMLEWEKDDGTIIRTNALEANIEVAVSLGWKRLERT